MTQVKDRSSKVDASHTVVSSALDANREFHNEEDLNYWLPKDEMEQRRLKFGGKKRQI